MIDRRIIVSASAFAALALLLLASPLGTYIAGAVLSRGGAAGSGWQVRIGATSGWLIGTPTLHDVRFENEHGDIAIRAEQLSYSPWSSHIRIRGPVVSVTQGETASSTDADSEPPRLPVGELPSVSLTGGVVEVRDATDSLVFVAEGVEVESAAAPQENAGAEPAVLVQLASKRLQVSRNADSPPIEGVAKVRLLVSADRVAVEELRIDGVFSDRSLAAQAKGMLLLHRHWPLEVDLLVEESDGPAPASASTRLHGTLSPLALEGNFTAALADSALGDVQLESAVTLSDARVTLANAKAGLLGGEIGLYATYAFEADSATIEADASNLQAHRMGLDFMGGLMGDRIDGTLEATVRPSISVYSGSMRARVQGARLLDQPPHDVELEADLSPSGHLDAVARTNLGRLAVTGDLDLSAAISYDLALAGHIDPTAVLGQAVSKLAVSGQVKPGDVRVRLRADEVSYLHDVVGPVGVDLQLTDGRYLSASAVVEGDQARAHLKADLESGQLDTLEAVVSTLPVDRVLNEADGELDAHLSGGGGLGLSTAKVSGTIGLGSLQLSGWTLGDITAALTLDEGHGKVELNGDGLAVVASVDTSGAFAGNATLAGARFVKGSDDGEQDRIVAGGHAHWAGNLSMGIDQWEAGLELDSLSAVLSGYDLHSDGPVRIDYAGAATTIDNTRWHTPLGDLLLRGTVGDELNLSAAIDSLTPAMVVPELAGFGSAYLDLTGSLRQPQAVAQISLGDLTMGGHPVGDFEAQLALRQPQAPDSMVVTAALDQSLLGLAKRAALSVRFSALADAVVEADLVEAADPSRALLQIEAVDLDASGPLSYVAGDSLSALLGVRGRLSLLASRLSDWGHAEGTLEIERLDLGNAAARVGLQAKETTVVHVAEGKRIEMPAAAVLPVQRFDDEQERFENAGMLSMRTASQSDRARVSIELEEVDLKVIEALSAGSIELPSGAIDGSLAIDDSTQGTALTLETVTYLDDFGELVIDSRGSETNLHLQAAWVTPVLDSLVVTLDAPWQMQDGVVDWEAGQVRARSDGINLFLLLELIPQLQNLDGFARADLEIHGLAGRSQVRGDIEIEDLELSLPDVTPGYVFPHGAVRFSGSGGRGEIAEFVGGTDGGGGRGRLELSGYIDLSALDDPDYELVVDAKGVPYRYEDTFDVPGLNFHVGFRRNAAERLLWGEINVDGAAIEPTLVNFSATTVPPPPALKNPFLESTALDLYLDLRNTRVKNELSDMMLEGSSRLYGTFYKPRFQGEIHLLAEGKIAVLSREFSLTKGRIGLDRLVPTYSILDLAYDPLLLNPELDIEAVADVWNHDDQEETEVVMTLSGTALQSEPVFSAADLGDTEVLSLLAFGSTKSFRTDDLYTAAGQLLLRGQVSKVGLDEFALLPSGTVSESIGETTVRVGKFFSFLVPIWVRYETPTSLPTSGEVELEYKLGSFLNIKASSQSEYDLYGAGIGVKKSY